MNNEKAIRIAVMSDLHAATPDKEGIAASFASTSPSVGAANQDAIVSLEDMFRTEGIRADYLLCCGDMADKASPTAIEYIWSKFQTMATELHAVPIATVGNHDIDSRYSYNDFDARGLLRGLRPSYPIFDLNRNHEFWSKNYVIFTYEKIRFVVLNSCAFHGYSPGSEEYLHGRISDRTLNDLQEELKTSGQIVPINILLTHHHPHKHQDIGKDYTVMINGERLIDMLTASESGRWMIVHGHKHHPRLCIGAGGGNSPIILGAGSLSAKLYPELQGRVRNQFHIINFFPEEAVSLGLDLAGEIESWDYIYGLGWSKAQVRSGLPSIAGFGSVPQFKSTAQKISALLTQSQPAIKWRDVIKAIPELRYTMPQDIERLCKELKSLVIEATVDENGCVSEIGRK